MTYQLLTTALAGDRQAEIVPAMYNYYGRIARLDAKQAAELTGLTRAAAEATGGLAPDDFYGRAKALER